MRINSTGIYSTRDYAVAEVTQVKQEFCVGFVRRGSDKPYIAVWHVADGTKFSPGPKDDLVEFLDSSRSEPIPSVQ
ncbi:MAG TPA: hypothetical protein VGD62_10395 [Acidobacteriaceae bacterium]